MTTVRALPCGPGALLLEAEAPEYVPALLAELRRVLDADPAGAGDVVPGACTVLVDGLDPAARDRLAAAAPGMRLTADSGADGPAVELPVVFDGPDLADVAAHWGVAPAEVAAIVTAAQLRVAFCGFAPGFAYMTGLGRSVPRRPEPRTSVPAGAVALAGDYTGVYPRSSPGGWQIVGILAPGAPALWDAGRDAPALLAPGTRVTFTDVGGGA